MAILPAACLAGTPMARPASAAISAWIGTWRREAIRPGQPPETLIFSDAGHGAMRMAVVEDGSVVVIRFDGAPAPDTGPRGKGGAFAIVATSPTTYRWTYLMAGRPLACGSNALSPDRRSFTERNVILSQPAKSITVIYRRR